METSTQNKPEQELCREPLSTVETTLKESQWFLLEGSLLK